MDRRFGLLGPGKSSLSQHSTQNASPAPDTESDGTIEEKSAKNYMRYLSPVLREHLLNDRYVEDTEAAYSRVKKWHKWWTDADKDDSKLCYVMYDPSLNCGKDDGAGLETPTTFAEFIKGVVYIGQGAADRPFQYVTAAYHRFDRGNRDPRWWTDNQSPNRWKIYEKIVDNGQNSVSSSFIVFPKLVQKVAYDLEGCMIAAMGANPQLINARDEQVPSLIMFVNDPDYGELRASHAYSCLGLKYLFKAFQKFQKPNIKVSFHY
ncbi:hypothetical protein DdX_13581 [Ditylenchus destructor]|uniref:Uncharacterized protein n=1 Tax=Ditylenchus destructor TaxID=166010 RepID=A0AAD4MYC7_9BILA|nr:hypothetical protein DdX_13581 [Ditylenchus destructor]